MAPGQVIDIADLPAELRETSTTSAVGDWKTALASEADRLIALAPGSVFEQLNREFEALLIRRALAATAGRRIDAAQILGIGRNTITRKIQELGLE
jgi:two-component system nitrogen regulation response regulator GlnG